MIENDSNKATADGVIRLGCEEDSRGKRFKMSARGRLRIHAAWKAASGLLPGSEMNLSPSVVAPIGWWGATSKSSGMTDYY